MFTEGLSPAAAAEAPTSAGSKQSAAEAKQQFLTLLVAQISNQNPMNPMDDKQMVSQLAQFSQVEQAIETNKLLESLQDSQSAQSRLGMAGLIGKDGTVDTSSIHVKDGLPPPDASFELAGDATQVAVRLLDSEGNVVKTINPGHLKPGMQTVNFNDSKDGRGPLEAGHYRLQVSATNAQGENVQARYQMRGKISGVEMQGSEAMIWIGGVRVSARDVVQVNG